MSTLLLVAGTIYVVSILLLTGGLWRALRRFENARAHSAVQVKALPESAVVVATRNEDAHLPVLLSSLDGQEYPEGRLHIVIVDEGSTDSTDQILASFRPRRHRFHTLCVDTDASECSPKKVALAAGIEATDASLILLTDADTTPPPAWAASLAAALAGGCPVVAGHSPSQPRLGLLGWAAGMWELGSSALAGGFIGLGFAVHVSGRNWGFHRDLFEMARGYEGLEHILSGDDTLLAQKLAGYGSVFRWGFTLSPPSQVPTRPPSSCLDFARQKHRHFATAKRFRPFPLLVAVVSFLLFSLLWTALVTTPLGSWHPAGLLVVTAKVAVDCICFLFAAARAGQIKMALSTPVWSVMHLSVYPLLQLAATFVPFRWKGRRGI